MLHQCGRKQWCGLMINQFRSRFTLDENVCDLHGYCDIQIIEVIFRSHGPMSNHTLMSSNISFFMSTYFSCGTYWCSLFLTNIKNNAHPIVVFDLKVNPTLWLHAKGVPRNRSKKPGKKFVGGARGVTRGCSLDPGQTNTCNTWVFP